MVLANNSVEQEIPLNTSWSNDGDRVNMDYTFNTFSNGNQTGLRTPNNQRVKRGRVTDSASRRQKESDKAAATHIKSSHVGGGGKKSESAEEKGEMALGARLRHCLAGLGL